VTESEWLECTDPTPMLEFLRGKASDRKLRLFSVACCRRKWKFFGDDRCRKAVEIAELFADDENRVGDLDWAAQGTRLALNEWRPKQGSRGVLVHVSTAAHALAQSRNLHVVHIASQVLGLPVDSVRARAAEALQQANLLRDAIGTPFRPIAINSSWITPTVLNLARAAYDERIMPSGELDLARLAVLSDALEEAGCDNPDILNHLRSPGPHVRGCWVVDLLLGKE
jgi:hypothetical protein